MPQNPHGATQTDERTCQKHITSNYPQKDSRGIISTVSPCVSSAAADGTVLTIDTRWARWTDGQTTDGCFTLHATDVDSIINRHKITHQVLKTEVFRVACDHWRSTFCQRSWMILCSSALQILYAMQTSKPLFSYLRMPTKWHRSHLPTAAASNRSISPANLAAADKNQTVAAIGQTNGQTDRQTDRFIDPAVYSIRI